MTAARATTSNPLTRRDAELMERLAAVRRQAQEMLLNHLAADALGDPTFRADRRSYAADDLRAVVQVLRVLTRPSWDDDDLRLLDAYWRQAIQMELFAAVFEADRHRLRESIETARQQLAVRAQPAEEPGATCFPKGKAL